MTRNCDSFVFQSSRSLLQEKALQELELYYCNLYD